MDANENKPRRVQIGRIHSRLSATITGLPALPLERVLFPGSLYVPSSLICTITALIPTVGDVPRYSLPQVFRWYQSRLLAADPEQEPRQITAEEIAAAAQAALDFRDLLDQTGLTSLKFGLREAQRHSGKGPRATLSDGQRAKPPRNPEGSP